jgi:taurine dioxygenase
MSATIGVEVAGIDLTAPLPDRVVADLLDALGTWKVLVFRDQPLSSSQHVELTARFGPAGIHPLMAPNPHHPGVEHVERGAERTGFENAWHSDISWHPTPAMGTILHALEVPDAGGDTLFADTIAAWADLAPALQARVEGRTAAHDFSRVVAHQTTPDELADLRRRHPASHHPVVRRDTATGEPSLYVNEYFTDRIDGLDPDEGAEVLGALCRWIERPEFQCRLRWGAPTRWPCGTTGRSSTTRAPTTGRPPGSRSARSSAAACLGDPVPPGRSPSATRPVRIGEPPVPMRSRCRSAGHLDLERRSFTAVPEPISPAAEELGARVRARRQELGLTLESAAPRCGVHWSYLGQLERGRRNVSLHNLLGVAAGLDVDPATLVTGLLPPARSPQR